MELKPSDWLNVKNLISLLIVPYGIETYVPLWFNLTSLAFNRTLWN